ncbi:mechanosensitive ion channel family protein [Hallella colorans]|uniref:mechanosensitive ion channel family protein n=1 Tax=Hallella colorans TaxID=1703337 RepID=UPI0023F4EC59|nr:mechanosensitive ion channel domain-containing protein [Hallella colorans]
MIKKIVLTAILLITTALSSHAVLKEKDLVSTLAILREELTNYHMELERQVSDMKEQQEAVTERVLAALRQSQQNAIMLYSQQSNNIFDLTYACHEATEQYHKFKVNAAPFREYIKNANIEVNRYDSLINDLNTMYVQGLPQKAKLDRDVCLTLAISIKRTLKDNRTQMQQYVTMYEETEERLKHLDNYANKRYQDIQGTIFNNAGDSYLKILRNLRTHMRETGTSVEQKYKSLSSADSDWDIKVILGLLVVLVLGSLIAAVLNYLTIGFALTRIMKTNKLNFVLRWFVDEKEKIDIKRTFQAKRLYIILAATVITFAIILGVVRLVWDQNFIIMACRLLVEYAWLSGVILLSLLIRLNASKLKNGFRIYTPIMGICLIVISFRIILIPNDLVNLIFPPILLICMIWQWYVTKKYHHKLPKSDIIYSYISLAVFIVSLVAAFIGYTLLSVEMLIWWTMQMTCILTLTCVSSVLKNYGNAPKRRYFEEETPITRKWLFMLVYKVMLPAAAAISVLVSIYWAADVFNLSSMTREIFNMRLIESKNFTLSLYAVTVVVILFFVFAYINRAVMSLLQYNFWLNEQEQAMRESRLTNQDSVTSRMAMWRNVIQVLVWGAWALVTMNIFNINNTWIVAISAGLSTGVGFALKDILENIYYGISLMAGRIKVGDYISIDGTRGTVKSITYVSTMLEALDGSVIAFQNSQLFAKNYKNLTKNHGNELDTAVVGVAYGSSVKEVKKTIAEAVRRVNKPGYIKYIDTVVANFGDNSVDYKVFSWVDSRNQAFAHGDIMEAIYDALNKKGIEIPFPQRDIHMISDATKQPAPITTEEEAMKIINQEKQK